MGQIQLTAAMPNKVLERDAAKNAVPPAWSLGAINYVQFLAHDVRTKNKTTTTTNAKHLIRTTYCRYCRNVRQ